MASPYTPDEPSSSIRAEETWLQGALLSGIVFGVEITLAAMSFSAIYKQMGSTNRIRNACFMAYIVVLSALMTAAQGLSAEFIQMGFITHRYYPGGPSQFFIEQYSTPTNLVATILLVCANWCMECLLVWRCKIIYCGDNSHLWSIMLVPSLLLIGSFVTGGLFIRHTLGSTVPTTYALAYSGTSLVLNLTTTAIIVGRLLMYRRRVTKIFGPGHGSHYSTAAALIIESASLYTGFLLLIIVPFTINNPISNTFQQVIAQVQSVSSFLIIFRIAQGKGWSATTGRAMAYITTTRESEGRQNRYELNVPAENEAAVLQSKLHEALTGLSPTRGDLAV
ncbi:hypothetical protein F5I97DRAFT_1977455 [Phlebopus sp. FC_14]|nr:hypothetical protein F5I97DRAFT_1977455 [Phlebopus sp. FC_14]